MKNPNANPFNQPRFLFLAGLILTGALSRLIPHPPNFSPIAALALFGGAQFDRKRAAFLVPLTAVALSDLLLGLYSLIPVVYGSFALIVCLGFWLRRRQSPLLIAGTAIVGAGLFFVLTNFGVWAFGSLYPKSLAGLSDCYAAAIPFFRNTLLSDLLYCGLLFGVLRFAEYRWPRLAVRPAAARL